MPTPDGLLRIVTAPLALPTGMHDLLPPRAEQRRALAQTLLGHFERFGYELVIPPAFEREEVVARGLSERARNDLVRFLEPESGDVVALRPDMTPQIARLAATHYRDALGPLRFMYEGTVVRRPRGRARRHRQIAQAGIECIGWSAAAADIEVIRAASGALDAVGLAHARIELGHGSMAGLLLHDVPAALKDAAADALAARDTATLARLLGGAFGADAPLARAIELAGGAETLDRAERHLTSAPFRRVITELRATLDGLAGFGIADRVLIDFAEIRGLGYYTGVAFQLLADGPGEPLGAGGRYDTLLSRYGSDRPATGCALDLEHLEWALGSAEIAMPAATPRMLLAGECRSAEAERLRATGAHVAECSAQSVAELVEIARQGHFQRALYCRADGIDDIAVPETT